MVARLIRQGYVQKLDKANIPNAKNLEAASRTSSSTRDAKYSLPWQTGFACIGYNTKATGGKKIETMTQLLTDPSLKGKVTLLTEMRDTVGLVLLEQGKDPANFTDADFKAAIDMIQKAKDAGQIQGSPATSTPTASPATSPPAWPGPVTSSQLQLDDPDVRLRPAGDGLHPVVGQLRHPGDGQAQEERREADQLLLRPEGHGEVEAWVNYISPVKGTKEVLAKIDPEPRRPTRSSSPRRTSCPRRRCSATSPPRRRPSTPACSPT